MDKEIDVEAWEKSLDSPDFKHGLDVGKSFGAYDTYMEAQRAFDRGEIELWLSFQRPKTSEEWEEWEAEHGDLADRWNE